MELIDRITIHYLEEFGLNDSDIEQIFQGTSFLVGTQNLSATCLLMNPEDNIPYVELKNNVENLRTLNQRTGGVGLGNIYKYHFSLNYLINGCKLRIEIANYVMDSIFDKQLTPSLIEDLNKCLKTMLLPYISGTDLIVDEVYNNQLIIFLQSVVKINKEKIIEYTSIYESNKEILDEFGMDKQKIGAWNNITKKWLYSLNPEHRAMWSDALSKGFHSRD